MATADHLSKIEAGGLIAEDVIPRLFDLTEVDRPLIDSIGRTDAHNQKKEFTDKVLPTPNSDAATFYENQNLSGIDDSSHGNRYYNYCQQLGQVIKTSQRGRDVDLTYDADEFLQQLMDAGEVLRMNEEHAAVGRNATVAENPGVAGSKMAGAVSWCLYATSTRGTALSRAGATGSLAALDSDPGGGPTTAPVSGTKYGVTETMIREVLRAGWDDGARFNLLMSIGDMIENIANYMYTSTARVAAMQTDVAQSNRTGVEGGNGARQGGVVAQGAINMFVGNFGTVTLTPNRQMEVHNTDKCDILFIDTRYPTMAYLHDYDTKKLGQTGLYDQEVMYVDSVLIPSATRAIAGLLDVDPAEPMTA